MDDIVNQIEEYTLPFSLRRSQIITLEESRAKKLVRGNAQVLLYKGGILQEYLSRKGKKSYWVKER